MGTKSDLVTLQNDLGYKFRNIGLLEEALTHDSNRVNALNSKTYQRLEFLGDSVINLIITEYLYEDSSNMSPGLMTERRKECTNAMAQSRIAEQLHLEKYISFGASVDQNKFRKQHCFVESIIGAIYIDGGFDVTMRVVKNLWKIKYTEQSCNLS